MGRGEIIGWMKMKLEVGLLVMLFFNFINL